jgi:hypothetical protein
VEVGRFINGCVRGVRVVSEHDIADENNFFGIRVFINELNAVAGRGVCVFDDCRARR